MKINLIYLPHPYLIDPQAQLPLGLLYIAAVLEQNKIPVIISNLSSYKTNKEAINSLSEADIYGITVTSLEVPQANKFANELKKKYPNCKVILGGPGTFTPEFIDWNCIDSICQGDGEITILQIIQDYKKKNLMQIYYGVPVVDLNTLPTPSRHLLGTNYFGGHIFANRKTFDKTFRMEYKKHGSCAIITSRGCNWACFFCAAKLVNPILRFRSPQKVYEEIKQIYDSYKIKQYRFSDEAFTANPRHVKEICKLIKPLGIVWRVSARVKPLSLELLKIMKSAGCVEISFGIESFDNKVLEGLNKGTSAEDNYKAICMAKEAGMMVRVLFMIRTPLQTAETIEINKQWISRCNFDTIACTSFVPLPATEIYNNPDKFGIEILNKNLADYNFYMFGNLGKTKLKDIIKIKNRGLEEFNKESEEFREWVIKQGKANRG